MYSKAGCQEMKVSQFWLLETKYHHWMIKKGFFCVYFFVGFFFLEALKEKKLDYSTGNFNQNPFQPHFLIILSTATIKIHLLYYYFFLQTAFQIPQCCNGIVMHMHQRHDKINISEI